MSRFWEPQPAAQQQDDGFALLDEVEAVIRAVADLELAQPAAGAAMLAAVPCAIFSIRIRMRVTASLSCNPPSQRSNKAVRRISIMT